MRRLTVALAAASACAALPLAGFAQGFQNDRYAAPMNAGDLFWTERAAVTPHLDWGAVIVADDAYAPALPPSTDPSHPAAVVANDLRLHLAATIGFFDRFQVGVAMPFVLAENGFASMQSALAAPVAPALGDARADARVRLYGPNTGAGVRVALAGALMVPTGNPAAYASDGFVAGNVRAIGELELERGVRVALNVGVSFRPSVTAGGYTVGDTLDARLGVAVPTLDRRVWTSLELAASTGPSFFAHDDNHLEATLGVKYAIPGGWFVGTGAGPGFAQGVGTPVARGLLMFGRGIAERAPGAPVRDSDRDGVEDRDDLCPYVPAGARPDPSRRGCPVTDRDRDGVLDARDACPDEPAGEHPDATRPGCPARDRDHDGVLDPDDACPDTPAGDRPDAQRRGCPDPDRDHDGIPNEADACVDEPGERSADPHENGCPRQVRVRGDQIVILEQVHFAVNGDRILPASFPLLLEVARVIGAHPEIHRVRIEGHTDSTGSPTHNLDLSNRRAASVRQFLVDHGVAADRLEARGFGSTHPLADNATPENRARNRRVEFHIADPAPAPASTPSPAPASTPASAPASAPAP